ncbi:MAG TPA: Re/Si-specific NAD(P)(+) transhydrogenase subunit alpha [Thermoguttaceae bacterium]|nr:Re/Si-specific NAD(P)(+) transhydrogenase subunit alpha [Thermoguttaceae bacterium]
MLVAVARESLPGENRVALVPASVPALAKAGLEVIVESSAGQAAGYPDEAYAESGAKVVASRAEALAADVVVQVRAAGANPEAGRADLERLRRGQVVIGMCDPLAAPQAAREVAARGVTLFALELLPRITRAQSMDVLSSMATVSGYRAVLLAATHLPKMFPMLMTAAGTVRPAKVFVMGAGVAGLQAIATARRLGAVVSANDIRPAVAEQVESLGAKFVQLDLDTGAAEDKGGYAKEMGEEFLRRQRELIARVVAESDVVITTAAVPGKKAPTLVTAEMVSGMAPGSVIVDLAAERGGNCELTRPGETVVSGGVSILGPTNPASDVPYHASQMYAKNISTFLLHLVHDGRLKIDLDDEITRETLIARDGHVVHPQICELLGIEPPARDEPPEAADEADTSEESAEKKDGYVVGDDEYGLAE